MISKNQYNGDLNLKTTGIIVTTVLLLVCQTAYALESQGSSTSFSDAASASAENSSLKNASLINGSMNPFDLQGIWSFRLDDKEQMTVVLHQQGEFIIGSAKSEGETPWNAVMQGSTSEGSLDLTLSYLMNKSLVSLQLTGVAENESVIGSFVLVDDLGRFEEGIFKGTKINTDLSAYAPARLLSDVESAGALAPAAELVPDTTAKPVVVGNPMYQDVPSRLGSVPMSIGVGFVGDGTAGAGGMGLG
jgi:hypothetical protein